MRIMGVDFGDSRIGIALSDPFGLTAQGICTLEEKCFERQVSLVADKAAELNAEKIVLGMPKNMNGTIGERGEKTKRFADALAEKCNLHVELWDERLTSAAAHKTLAEGNVSGKKRKGLLDKLSAVFILQGYLDFKGGGKL